MNRKHLLSLTVFFFLPVLAFAHGNGGSFEEVVGSYLVDVGYSVNQFTQDELTRFDFLLYDGATKAPAEFTDVWVRLEHDGKPLFAGALSIPKIGAAGFSTQFPDAGDYKITARYGQEGRTLVEYTNEFTVLKDSSANPVYPYRWFILMLVFFGAFAYFQKEWVVSVVQKVAAKYRAKKVLNLSVKQPRPNQQLHKDQLTLGSDFSDSATSFSPLLRFIKQAALFVAVAGATFLLANFLFSSTPSLPSQLPRADIDSSKSDSQSIVYVTLTEEGYQPSELFIKTGTKVIFKTTVNRPHWPASNLHPTHEIYSAFDPKKPIPATEEWSFVFDKVGDWKFHDHIRSYYTGIIHVSE